VAGPFQFTHTAAHQAWYAAVNALFGDLKKFKADYSVIPWATFIDPEVARVGLNEQEPGKRGIAYEVTRSTASTTWTAPLPTAKPTAL
jgi:pyruvate/2-oxoglutarate dehydrogenase complex dihydrolipoamide dehydrogenase (E3) component